MDLLLTGASGFLGRNVILGAPDEWRILAVYSSDSQFPEFIRRIGRSNVTPVCCDLGNPDQVEAVFDEYGGNWDSCLYLAAKVDIPWSVREPRADLRANVLPLLNVLDVVRTRRFVYFSSGAVYDGMTGEVHPGCPPSPTLPYAISKLTAERYVECYANRKKSIDDYLLVRFFGAY
jgi:nucleoside-diphosphate-sugar epimerase